MSFSYSTKRNESSKRKLDENGKKSPKRMKSEEDLNSGRVEKVNPSSSSTTKTTTTTTPPAYFIALPCSPSSYASSSLSINTHNNNGQLHNDHLHPHHHQDSGRLDSKKIFAIHQQRHQQMRGGLQLPTTTQSQLSLPTKEQDEFFSRNGWIATTLVATYLIEVTVQILLIVQCCRSIKQVDIRVGINTDAAAAAGSLEWLWILVLSPVLSSFLVTLVSLVWVFRGMDFSGRICGRLLCYVMHSFLLGLLWRYLKLAFAYDKADLEEFFKLKAIHSYIQSLPLVTIHFAWLLGMQQNGDHHTLSSWLVVLELISAVTSLVILPRLNNLQGASSSPGRRFPDNAVNDKTFNVDSGFTLKDKTTISISSGLQSRGLLKSIPFSDSMDLLSENLRLRIGRTFLLTARLILLGMFLHKMSYYWTGFITLSHLFVCFTWITGCVVIGERKSKVGSDVDDESNNKNSTPVILRDVDDQSDSNSSNDSGLVIKSEIPEDDQNTGQVNDLACVNGPQNEGYPITPNCLANIIHRRKLKLAKDSKLVLKSGNLREAVLTRVIPLTYVLLWDVNLSSPATCFKEVTNNRTNFWAALLPVFLAFVENLTILICNWKNQQNDIIMINMKITGAICLIFGWLLMIVQLIYSATNRKKISHDNDDDVENNVIKSVNEGVLVVTEDDESDEGINCNIDLSGNSDNDNEGRTKPRVNKETGEWLPLCCSSLSHPLNIKRKGHHQRHHDHDQDDLNEEGELQQPPQNFCKNLVKNESKHDVTIIAKKYNEYEEQQELGRGRIIMKNGHRHHHHHHNHHDNNEGTDKNDMKDECGRKKREEVDDEVSTARCLSVPVTNSNYTNIKEALTRRISNKSCRSSLGESHYHLQHQHQHQQQHYHNHKHHHDVPQTGNKNCLIQTSHSHHHRSSKVKGEVVENLSVIGKGGEMAIAGFISTPSFKSTTQSSATLPHQHLHLQNEHRHQPQSLPNSHKCIRIPISIKSPISWLPLPEMQCCNESSGSSSSNSRNTNTKSFYCPEKSVDFDNHIMKMRTKETEIESRRRGRDGEDRFSVVFFEGNTKQRRRSPVLAPSTTESYFQNQPDDDDVEGKAVLSRNRITGKTYLSDGASLTSLDGLCFNQVRASTPVEIKKASRVIVNHPPPHHKLTDSKTVSRCLCNSNTTPKVGIKMQENGPRSGANNNSIYEKLMDDSYGILICEGEEDERNPNPHQACLKRHCSCDCEQVGFESVKGIIIDGQPEVGPGRLSSSSFRNNNNNNNNNTKSAKLRILCKKCLGNHDPLLTNCEDHFKVQRGSFPVVSQCPTQANTHTHPIPESDGSTTTDYPSDTEFTVNNHPLENDDVQSLSTHFSSATYTWQPNHYQPTQLSQFIWAASSMAIPPGNGSNGASDCPKEFTSLEYVRTWLMASHPRAFPVNPQNLQPPSKSKSSSNSKRKNKFRQLEKRQRPVGRGASPPPAKEVMPTSMPSRTPTTDNFNSCLYANTTTVATTTTTTTTLHKNNTATEEDETCAPDMGLEPQHQQPPPPSRKQHPLLVYDMVGRQERNKPLLTATPTTSTPHKKCRDQLDLFHKELETVV